MDTVYEGNQGRIAWLHKHLTFVFILVNCLCVAVATITNSEAVMIAGAVAGFVIGGIHVLLSVYLLIRYEIFFGAKAE